MSEEKTLLELMEEFEKTMSVHFQIPVHLLFGRFREEPDEKDCQALEDYYKRGESVIDEEEELPDVRVSNYVKVKVNLSSVQMQNKIPLNMPLLISDNVVVIEFDNDLSASEEERLAAEEFFGSLKSPILIKKE